MASIRALGPYELLRELGSGSYGSVQLGRHRESGAEVAIKTVSVPSESHLASLRREIRALERIRHPGVVRILDDGVTSRGPWYAMEVVAGTTLLRYVERLAPGPELPPVDPAASTEPFAAVSATEVMAGSERTEVFAPPAGMTIVPDPRLPFVRPPSPRSVRPAILTTIRRLCAPLAYLHGEGILHRDLKPDNVLVTPDGVPVIVDFGLMGASLTEQLRETMEVVGDVAGTALYMAPEQARGELLDARADIYSLGCILYQLLAGRPPFVSENPSQVLFMHVRQPPLPPSKLCDDLDPRLEDLLMTMLAKDPRARIGHADDVAAALLDLGARSEVLPGPRPRTYLYRAALRGREKALVSIEPALLGLASGKGGLLLVTGEAGAGKTRLAKEIGRRAMRVQIRVIASDCARSLQGTAPLQGFRGLFEAISDRCRERGHDEALRLLGGNASIVAPYDSGLLRLTESLQMPRAAPLAPDAARLRLFRSLAEVLKAFAKLGPLVLLVDDLQEADELTPAALDYLARSGVLADCPALVVACYRSEEASTDVQRIKNAPGAREVVAERLDPAAIAAIVSDMLALPDLPDPFARFLERTAEGNPFFVAQYLRTAVLEGILVRDGSGQWRMRTVDSSQAQPLVEALPLPTSLHELISRRLLGISGTARDVVDTASVLGREVDPDLLQAVTGLPEDALEEAIDELVRRHCLQRSGSRLLFRHASLRDLAYASIEETRRASCHRRAAEHLEARAGGSDALLGRHWERAGETANARSCYRVAMLAAHDRFANREAEELARAYLALTPEPTVESVAVRSTLGDALRLQGKTALALAEQARTLDEARSLGDRGIEAHAENALAGLEHVMGNPEKARARYESALRTCRQLGDTRLQATILENLALLHGNQGDGDAAEALHREVLAMHRAAGNHRGAVVVMSNYGGFLQEQGRLEPALAILREALPLAEKDGERDMLGNIHGNQGAIYEARGELRQAQEGYERALAIHRSIGSRLAEGISLANLAHVASHRGSTKDGLAYARDARRIAAEVQALRLRAFVAAVEGSLSMADGDAATARARFDEAVELATDRHPYFAAMALRGMARLDAQEGDIDGALASGARSLELARQVDDKRGEAAIVVTLATVCRRAGLDKPDDGELANAESTLRRAGDALGLALCLCERGHRAIARGEPAAAQLAEAETIAQAAGLEAGASLASRVAALRRAIHRAQSERGALSAGECPEDYPPRLLAAISRAPRRPDGNDDTRAAPSRG